MHGKCTAASHSLALGVVGGGVQRRGRAPLPGVVVEAVAPARGAGVDAAAEQDHGAAQQAEAGAHPAGVEREAERHQTLLPVSADGEPDRRYAAAQGWRTQGDTGAFVRDPSLDIVEGSVPIRTPRVTRGLHSEWTRSSRRSG